MVKQTEKASCDAESCGVVFRGSFNPGLYHPAWLAKNELISKRDAEAAKDISQMPGFIQFTLADFELTSDQDRLQIIAPRIESSLTLKDFATGMLNLLPHTPISAIGVNRDMHFRLPNSESASLIGDTLSPKEPWMNILEEPLLRRLDIQGKLPDDLQGKLNIRVGPSELIRKGVLIHTNAHLDFTDDAELDPTEVLENHWESLHRKARNMAEQIIRIGATL